MSRKQGELEMMAGGGISTATEWSCLSHMGQLSIETSQKGLEVHVEEADGSNMSGVQQDGDMTAERLSLNGSAALGLHDQGMNSALHGGFHGFQFWYHTIKIGCIDVFKSLICLLNFGERLMVLGCHCVSML